MNLGFDEGLPLPPHSALGASSMERWMHCPGSFGLSQRERHRAPTIHAATGTVAHDLVQWTLLHGHADPRDSLGKKLGSSCVVDGHTVVVDETMLEGVGMMLAYLARRAQDLGLSPLIEETVFVDSFFPPEAPPPVRMFGRSDARFQTPELLEIVDYKNGSGVLVHVVDHPQLLYYAAGSLAAMGMGVQGPKRVRLTVVQPNARTEVKIRSYDLLAIDVLMWVHDTMIPAVRRCEAPDAPYVPGSWCNFCPVAHACPRLLEDARTAARAQFDDSAEGLEVGELLGLAEHVELWITAYRNHALERARRGLDIPGWGIMPTRPRRVWTDPHAVVRDLHAVGVDPFKSEIKSPAQMEKALKALPDVWKHINQWIESRSSGEKIARINPDAGGLDFDMLEP